MQELNSGWCRHVRCRRTTVLKCNSCRCDEGRKGKVRTGCGIWQYADAARLNCRVDACDSEGICNLWRNRITGQPSSRLLRHRTRMHSLEGWRSQLFNTVAGVDGCSDLSLGLPIRVFRTDLSRLMSIAALRDVLSAFKSRTFLADALKASGAHDLETIERMQNDDGGFGFWKRGDEQLPYIGIHVAHAAGAREKRRDTLLTRRCCRNSKQYACAISRSEFRELQPSMRSGC